VSRFLHVAAGCIAIPAAIWLRYSFFSVSPRKTEVDASVLSGVGVLVAIVGK
jgi:hypothetical protein